MKIMILLATFSALFVLCAAQGGTNVPMRCFPQCKFVFCSSLIFTGGFFTPLLHLGKPDAALTEPICLRGDINLGRISSTGEAYINKPELGGVVGLSEVGEGFSPSFFKTYDVMANGTMKSGVGHETITHNQRNFLIGGCVGLPVRSYQVLAENGDVIGNEQGTDRLTDCISFFTLGGLP